MTHWNTQADCGLQFCTCAKYKIIYLMIVLSHIFALRNFIDDP